LRRDAGLALHGGGGKLTPTVLICGLNSDLPGPILILIPQGSRLIGAYQNASTHWQRRVQIAWQWLIFPNTSSMNLAQMPGTDQNGYAGFADQADNHYLATFGTAALMSLISAGQMVGADDGVRRRRNLRTLRLLPARTVGDGGRDGELCSLWSVRWTRPADDRQRSQSSAHDRDTARLHEFKVIVTQELVFVGAYGK
jgi:hypothetical protein